MRQVLTTDAEAWYTSNYVNMSLWRRLCKRSLDRCVISKTLQQSRLAYMIFKFLTTSTF